MDHIRLPNDPILPLRRVPKLCKDHQICTDHDFGQHLVDSGFIPDSLGGESSEMLYDHFKESEYTVRYLEGFFQGWIFFGLLHKLLSPFDLFTREDYLDVDDATGSETLHTRHLRQTLTAWRAAYRNVSPDERSTLAQRMYVCLYIAHWCFASVFAGDEYRDFSRDVSTSLEVLCETITAEFRHDISEMPSFGVSRQLDERARDAMVRHGWCPSEIRRVEREFVASPSIRVFCQHTSLPDLGIDHGRCDLDGCRMLQIDMEVYRPRHVLAGCDCSMLGPDLAEVMSCLEDGDFPVLDVVHGSNGDLALKVISSKALPADEGYVALSHVWADGLGNPTATELAQCQIRRLSGLVQKTTSQSRNLGDARQDTVSKLYLWCDTLLCPIESHGKILAISKLQEVYERATYVLALDRSLEHYAYHEIGSTELGIRLQLSRWCQRLWTYQEAQLAVTLLIQLADVVVPFEDLYRELVNADTAVDPGAHALATTLRMTVHLRPPGLSSRGVILPFNIVDRSFAYRSVSVPTDEPICLATALSLDAGIVTRARPDQRWEAFWSLAVGSDAGISDGIIFHRRSRLQIKGYRWAPKTLKQSLRHMFRSTIAVEAGGLGQLTANGLQVTFAGWRFRRKQFIPVIMAEYFVMDRDIEDDSLYMKHPDGRWFRLTDAEQSPDELRYFPIKEQSEDWYLILSEDSWEDPETRRVSALLTRLEEDDDGHQFHRSTVLKIVRPISEAWSQPLELAAMHGDALRKTWEFQAGQLFTSLWRVLEEVGEAEGNRSHSQSNLLHVDSIFRKCLQTCFQRVRTRYLQHINRLGEDIPILAGAVAYMCGSKSFTNLDFAIAKLLLSGYGVVDEVYDSSSEWCVD